MIAILYNVKPSKDIALEILDRSVGRLVLNIQNRRKVALLKMYILKKVISLSACRRFVAPK